MNKKAYIFWIRSDKGTMFHHIIKLDSSLKRTGIEEKLEQYCAQFGAWHSSENYVRYGWVTANKSALNKLKKHIEMKSKDLKMFKKWLSWRKKNKTKLAFPFS